MCACTCVCSLLALCVHEIILVCVCMIMCVPLWCVCVSLCFVQLFINVFCWKDFSKFFPCLTGCFQNNSSERSSAMAFHWLTRLHWGFLLVDKTTLRLPVGWQNYSEASCWLTKLLWGFLLVDKTTLRLPVGWQLKNTPWGNLAAFPWFGHRILTLEIPLRWLCPGWRDACSEPAPPHRVETHPQECDWSCTCCNTTEPSVCYSGVVGVQCWVPWCESFMLVWGLHWVLWCWQFAVLC